MSSNNGGFLGLVLVMLMMATISLTCLKDDITFRIWQPLPAIILDENGNALKGSEQCGHQPDLSSCWVYGCVPDEDTDADNAANTTTTDNDVLCSLYKCWKGFCLSPDQRKNYNEIEFISNATTSESTTTTAKP